jgi:hypothetical protein
VNWPGCLKAFEEVENSDSKDLKILILKSYVDNNFAVFFMTFKMKLDEFW